MSANISTAQNKEDIYRTLETRRSVRSFTQKDVPMDLIKKIVNTARFAPSGMNRQPWEFVVVKDKKLAGKMFNNVAMLAGNAPKEEQSAPVYIVVLGNPSISSGYQVDCAFATSNILHAAWAEGLGTCVIGSVNRDVIKKLLNIPSTLEICWLVQLGYPAEQSVAVDADGDNLGRIKDNSGVMLVPKRNLDSILHINTY